jgi:hypothetical protein
LTAADPILAVLSGAPAEGATVAELAAKAGRSHLGTFTEVFHLLRAGTVERVGGRGTGGERFRLVEGSGV